MCILTKLKINISGFSLFLYEVGSGVTGYKPLTHTYEKWFQLYTEIITVIRALYYASGCREHSKCYKNHLNTMKTLRAIMLPSHGYLFLCQSCAKIRTVVFYWYFLFTDKTVCLQRIINESIRWQETTLLDTDYVGSLVPHIDTWKSWRNVIPFKKTQTHTSTSYRNIKGTPDECKL